MYILKFLSENVLWGVPMLFLLIICGTVLVIKTRAFIYINPRLVIKKTVGTFFTKGSVQRGSITPFQAVSTALAGTIGTGNIVGVAVALALGGPGSVFWMWITALFGMVIKYSEVLLAVYYRRKNCNGEFVGGPMYYIRYGLNSKVLAAVFSVFCIISTFGIGNLVQVNSISGGLNSSFGIDNAVIGVVLSLLCAVIIIGGIKRIASIAELIIPFMAIIYTSCCIYIIFCNAREIPNAFYKIFSSAFSATPAIGGISGYTVASAVRTGMSKGIFTNEAGLGSAPIAHAAANAKHPAEQGFWGAFEVFADTIIMCTVTALALITTGVWGKRDSAIAVGLAFDSKIQCGKYIVVICLAFFAFATVIAWSYYGEKCIEYLSGEKYIVLYRIIYILCVFLGCMLSSEVVWLFADICNSLMCGVNCLSLIMLSDDVRKITKDYNQ